MGGLRILLVLCVVGCGSSSDPGDGTPELCNGIDDDADGKIDEEPSDGTTYLVDGDGDGFGAEVVACTKPPVTVERGGDCADNQPTAFPGSTATEVPKDGVDTDCDGNDFCTDLNCDGRADVVVPSHHDGDYNITQAARLLSGTGGGWALEATPIQMNGTLGVAVGDLDNDGYQDIVHASYNDGTTVNTMSFVYWGKGGHKASERTPLPTHGAHWVCLGDFDKNGWTDVVFADATDGVTNNVDSYVYRNRPGGFAELDRVVLPTRGAVHCNVDDLNGDGFLDIVFANYNNGSYAVDSTIYWGSADADFKTKTDLPTMGTRASTIADLDGDGKKDIIFWSHYNGANYITDDNYIYWNRDGFSVANRSSFNSMGGFKGAVSDLNGDGFLEIIAAGYHNNGWQNMATTYIYWGNAAHTYTNANRTGLSLKGALDVIVDDINGDGFKDILLPGQYDGDSQAPSAILWGTAGGTYNDANRLELTGFHVTNGAAVVDFNHDGYKDVFLPGYHNNITGMDATPWANQAFSRIYWGSATGLKATFFDQWPTRGAWDAVIAGH